MVLWKRIQLGTMRLWGRSLTSLSGLRHCCELWYRSQTWLRSDVAVAVAQPAAVAPIRHLPAWEPPYAAGAALKSEKKKKKRKKERKREGGGGGGRRGGGGGGEGGRGGGGGGGEEAGKLQGHGIGKTGVSSYPRLLPLSYMILGK